MKKIIALILGVFLLTGCAFAADYSSLSVDELHKMQSEIRTELLKRDLVAGEKLLLFDQDGVSCYLTGEYEDSLFGLELKAILINDTDKTISVTPENLKISVNGWDVSSLISLQANPGKKSKGEFTFSLEEADISSYSEIEEIEFNLYVFDQDSFKRIFTLDPITVQFPLQ